MPAVQIDDYAPSPEAPPATDLDSPPSVARLLTGLALLFIGWALIGRPIGSIIGVVCINFAPSLTPKRDRARWQRRTITHDIRLILWIVGILAAIALLIVFTRDSPFSTVLGFFVSNPVFWPAVGLFFCGAYFRQWLKLRSKPLVASSTTAGS